MDFFDGFSRAILSVTQVCAALAALILTISQLTAKSRHMKSAAFWRDELKVLGNAEYTRLVKQEHLSASAKVYAESTISSRRLLGLYAGLSIIYVLVFFFSVAFKQVLGTSERLDDFLKIGIFPVGLFVLSVVVIKELQDMHFRKSGILRAITQGLAPFPQNELLPKQWLAYLGSISFTLGLFSLSFNFALTSPFPLKADINDGTLETVSYIFALMLIPLGMLIAVLRKSKIQHTESARTATRTRKISWLAHARQQKTSSVSKRRVRHKAPREPNF